MGAETKLSHYTEKDFQNFREKLDEETQLLKSWFDNKVFLRGEHKTGIELEAWLADENMLPDPYADDFLKKLNNKQVVPEVAKFNFEINSSPFDLSGKVFSNLENEMKNLWRECSDQAKKDNKNAVLIGTLPTLRPHMLGLEQLSSLNRYALMNKRVMDLRGGEPLYIRLEGRDNLYMYMDSVIAECAATSLQIHLGVNQEDAKRYYNASTLASPFLIALSANSPYFFGKELWDESRIAIFEQSVSIENRLPNGKHLSRVTLGNKYVENSLFELFEENSQDYPILLAEINKTASVEKMSHLQLHNGTIWRWTRPIIGCDGNGKPHLRIEQRTPSSGPTIADSTANSMFFIGLVDYFAKMENAPENIISFDEAVHNFYKASRLSFYAKVRWIDGELHDIKDLLRYQIFPFVKKALLERGIDSAEVEHYMDGIIMERLKKGVNGAIWQKAFVHTHGKRFQELLEVYTKNQEVGKPVHLWKV